MYCPDGCVSHGELDRLPHSVRNVYPIPAVCQSLGSMPSGNSQFRKGRDSSPQGDGKSEVVTTKVLEINEERGYL